MKYLVIIFLFLFTCTFAQNDALNQARPGSSAPNPELDTFYDNIERSTPIFEENFNGDNTVAGLETRGWVWNNVDGGGTSATFQGSTTVFPAYEGPADGYVGQNFNGANGLLIDQWLISPQFTVSPGDTLSFWWRAAGGAWDDSVFVLISDGGSNISDFTLNLGRNRVPDVWTNYKYVFTGSGPKRVAFRYYHTSGGPSGNHSNFWGLDFLQVLSGTQALSGNYFIPQGAHPKGFPNLADAITALNTNGLAGNTTFYITADLDHSAAALPVLQRNDLTENNRLFIRPFAQMSPVITLTGTAGIDIRNTSFVTIDGNSGEPTNPTRNLTFVMNSATGGGNGVISVTENCSLVVIENVKIEWTAATAAVVGVRYRRDDGNTVAPKNCLVYNSQIGTEANPFSDGVRIWGTVENPPKVDVLYNDIYTSHRGITTLFMENNIYAGNHIRMTNPRANLAWYTGMYLAGGSGSRMVIAENMFSQLGINRTSTGYVSAINININYNDSVDIYNNFFAMNLLNTGTNNDNRVYGIAVHREGFEDVYNIYHNTFLFPENNQTGNIAAIGFEPGTNFNPAVDDSIKALFRLGNNIIVNHNNTASSYGIYWPLKNGLQFSNYNNIFVSGANAHVGYWDNAARTTLANWQTASNSDANSVSKAVEFVSNTDLHLTGASVGDFDLAGMPISWITTDIDGDSRDLVKPYKGADEADTPLGIMTIAQAREDLNGDLIPDRLGQTVTIQGVVISPNYQTVNHSYYIFDGTAGICEILFGTTNPVLNLGDLVRMTGVIGQFRGLTQIQPAASSDITILSAGNPVPAPLVLTVAQYMSDPEAYEGTLLGFVSVSKVSGTWPSPGGSATIKVTDGTDTVDIRIDSDTDLDDNPEPIWPVDIIGIGSQFSSGTTVLNDGYQILPRYYASDILPPGTIPVELMSFTASVFNGTVTLSWSTATEVNNAGFEVERASFRKNETTPLQEWINIGFIPGHGTTTELQRYTFSDNNLASGKYSYRLKQIDYDGTFEYSNAIEVEVISPTVYQLSQNYPNPFNPVTNITYYLPVESKVTLSIYSITGELVIEMVNEIQNSGSYTVSFDAGNLSSGMYIYRLVAGDFIQSNKMMIMK